MSTPGVAGAPAPSAAASASSAAAPQRRAPSLMAKNCCVVGCETKREKEGYCMSHYQLFKANVSPAVEAARAKEQEKALAKMAKERARIEAAAAAQVAADNKVHHKRRASETGSGTSGGIAVHGATGAADKPAWWRRSNTASSSCFAAADSPNAAGGGGPQPFSPPQQQSAGDAPLLEDMRRAWVSAHKVVFKDLPRLAKRTSVQTDAGTMVEGGRVVRLKPPQQAAAAATPAAAAQDASDSDAAAASSSPPAEAAAASDSAGVNGTSASASSSSRPVNRASSSSVLLSPGPLRVSTRRSVGGSFPKGSDKEVGWMGTIDMRKHNKALWQAQWEQKGGVGAAPSPSNSRASFAGAGAPSPSSRTSVAAPSPMSRASVAAIDEKQEDEDTDAKTDEAAAAAAAASSSTAAAAPAAAGAEAPAEAAADAASSPDAAVDSAAAGVGMLSTSPAPSISSPDLYDSSFVDSVLINAGGNLGADGEVDTWQAVCNVVLTCIRLLEPPETLAAARGAFLAAAQSMHVGSDHQSLLEDIFTAHIGLYSRTFKVFQAIHQSILFPSIAYLHEHLYSHPRINTMKDVRRADGWTVLIYVTHHGALYVTHQRWEQSLHPESDPRHFQVRWEMRLSFDRDMQALRAVILRIQELKFHDDATPAYKQQIIDVLAGSGYIV